MPIGLGLIALALLVVLLTSLGGDETDGGRHLFVDVESANTVIEGQPIREAGVDVGRVIGVDPIEEGRAARIELALDEGVRPLTTKSLMTLRWGGTASFGNRYIDLRRDPGGDAIEEGEAFPTARFVAPVEFDKLLRAFPESARERLRSFIDNGGSALDASSRELEEVVRSSPSAVEEASLVLADLNADQAALHTLVRSADRVLAAVDDAQPGTRELLSGASATFAALSDEREALAAGIEQAPSTFTRARTTLARAEGTLRSAGEVTRRLRPGVAKLRSIARPLSNILETADDVGPDASKTLGSLRRAVPDLTRLLARAADRSPQLESIGRQADDNLECIRPYTPDIASFFSNWGDFFSVPDKQDKVIRAQVQNYFPIQHNIQTINAGQLAKQYPGIEYGFPRPPGTNAGQPWFLPECGAGPDALDPSKDPEARPFRDVFKIPGAGAGGKP